jgi:tRNA (guanine37-N1)-methyltransferase
MKPGKEKKPDKKQGAMVHSYDVIGDIALVEIPEGREKERKKIAQSILDSHSHIKKVFEKKGDRFGEFRLRELKPIIGKAGGTVTEHRESGCSFRLDVAKAYFSPREGTERERIAAQVKPNETVLVMFAGVGPYAVVIAKKQPKVRKVYAVEINPDAVKCMEENITLNKLKYVVEPVLGDVKDSCKKYYGKCDRIVMPLPHEGRKFLSTAIRCIKPRGIIHFYYIGPEDNLFKMATDIIKMECDKLGRRCRIKSQNKVLPYGPRMFKVCIDFEVV